MHEKKVREYIESKLIIKNETLWQDCPYTAIKITAVWMAEEFLAYGFTKVCWPDKWNAEYGEQLARDKALAKISKIIVSNLNDDEKKAYVDLGMKANVAA